AHWRDVSDMILPRRGRFLVSDRNKGARRNRKIIDNTGTLALRTMAAGLMSGITSPARPWFRLAPQSPALARDDSVQRWLADVEALLREIFSASNAYDALAAVYEELAAFGTAAMVVLPDFDDVITCETLTAGQYFIAAGKTGKVDTLYRVYSMTVAQVADEFAPADGDGKRDWSAVSPATRTLFDNNRLDAWVEVVQAIEPNRDHRPGPGPAWRKPWRSVWIEKGAPDNKLLRLSGFDEFPAVVARWNLTAPDIYGTSPAMDALGDVEQLQAQEKDKSLAIQKMVKPPLNVPANLRGNSVVNPLPNGTTFYDLAGGPTPPMATPLYQVQPRLAEMQDDMDRVRRRIRDAFYVDLWLMISQDERSGITATEINVRREEKLLMLGPVLERLHHEFLDPLIDRVFALANRAGLLPPPPPALAGQRLRVRYVSMLAQAQQAVAAGAIERLLGFAGNMAQANPAILDKLDLDHAIDSYADVIGADPRLLRPDDQVAAERAARAKQQQAAQAMEMMQQGAAGAQLLSQTDTSRQNALTDILGNVTGSMQ
ncbi:MAG: hypothetical protein RLZZ501_162, partial [Pseudomonadota bacterium]